MRDPLLLPALADVLAETVDRHAWVKDSASVWLRADEEVCGSDGVAITVAASLHPGEAPDAARDLLAALEARGFTLTRLPAHRGSPARRARA